MTTNLIHKRSNSYTSSGSLKEEKWTIVDLDHEIDLRNNNSIEHKNRSRNNSFCSSITDGSTHGLVLNSNITNLLFDDADNHDDDDVLSSYYHTLPPIHPSSNISATKLNNQHKINDSWSDDCISIYSSLKGNEYTFVEHIILPKDTLEGLCLKYKTSATRLRQVNRFSGSSLVLAPKRLIIPIKNTNKEIKLQDTTTMEYKIHKVLSECSSVGIKEIQA